MDLRRQFGIARKWFPLLVVSMVLAAVAAFAFSSVQQRVYEAKATLIVGQSLQALNPDFNQLMVSQRLSTTYATVATKRPALESVIEQLGLEDTPAQLSMRVWAEAPNDSTLLNLNAQDGDPAQAAAIANALADQLIATSPAIQGRQSDLQQSIDADLKATQEQIQATQAEVERLAALDNPRPADLALAETLQGRLVTLRSTYASLLSFSAGNAANLLSIVEPAIAPDGPVSPRTLLNTLLAAVVGLLLAAAVVAVIEYLDDRVKDADTVQEVAGLSTLGTVARMQTDGGRAEIYRLATLLYPRSAVAEAYRTLRTNIEFASVDAPIRTLLVTSSAPNEGKTITSANLAVAFAQAGRPTLLVDADLRKPGVHGVFQLPNEQGLTTLLRNESARVDYGRAPDRAGESPRHHHGSTPAQSGRAVGLPAHARHAGTADGRSGAGHLRRTTAPGGDRRGGHELLPGRHGVRGRCGAQPKGRPSPGTGGACPGRCERAGRDPQPGPQGVAIRLLRLLRRSGLQRQAGRQAPFGDRERANEPPHVTFHHRSHETLPAGPALRSLIGPRFLGPVPDSSTGPDEEGPRS